MNGGSAEPTGSEPGLRRRLTTVRGAWNPELTCENLTWFAVAVGVILRIWEYVDFRDFTWMRAPS